METKLCEYCGKDLPVSSFKIIKTGLRQGKLSIRCVDCSNSNKRSKVVFPERKFCKTCGIEKDIKDFPLRRNKPDYRCKECKVAHHKDYYEKNKEALRNKTKVWYEANKETANRKQKERYYETQEHQLKVARKRREAYPEANKNYYYAHREKCLAANRIWYKENRDWDNAKKQRRRARKMNNGGTFTPQEWQALKERYNYTCLRCFDYEPNIKLTIDHVIPLSKGGTNSIENIQVLCLSCNDSKGTKSTDYRCPF